VFYIFGGYVNGDKSNDLWKFDLKTYSWTCLAEGDYKLPIRKQNPKNIPPPRVGARMVLVDSKTLIVHTG
jgi:hypothetical protein